MMITLNSAFSDAVRVFFRIPDKKTNKNFLTKCLVLAKQVLWSAPLVFCAYLRC